MDLIAGKGCSIIWVLISVYVWPCAWIGKSWSQEVERCTCSVRKRERERERERERLLPLLSMTGSSGKLLALQLKTTW